MDLESEVKSVKVRLGGEVFYIKTDMEESAIERIAQFVEDRLKKGGTWAKPEGRKDLLLLSMNIAGELFETRRELEHTRQLLEQAQSKTQSLVKSLEKLDFEEEKGSLP